LILQIQRSWFCSIWSPKTEIIDKTVNSFQLNSKKIKNKKSFGPTGLFRPSRPAAHARARSATPCAASIKRRPAQQQPARTSFSFFLFFFFFPDAWDPSSARPQPPGDLRVYVFVQIPSPQKFGRFVADFLQISTPIYTP
jgi:hypothetical protein